MLKTQRHARLHACATVAVGAAGFVFGLSFLEWAGVVLAIMAVWMAEALNTALEFLADVVSPEFHPLIRHAKDVAAAAVLISAVGAVVVGLLVFGPRLQACDP